MRAWVIVEADPVADRAGRVLDAVEDDPLDHAVLLRAMRHDELLLQPIATDQGCSAPTGEDQPVVGPQKERARHLAQGPEPGDEGMLQGTGGGGGLAGSRQMSAQQFAGRAVDHQGQRGPAVAPDPDPSQVCRPTFVRRGRDRGHRLDAGPHADRALADLPALDLEDPLNRVLVEAQTPGHRPVAERKLLFDHRLDRLGNAGIDLQCGLDWLVIDRPPRHAEPGAELAAPRPYPPEGPHGASGSIAVPAP